MLFRLPSGQKRKKMMSVSRRSTSFMSNSPSSSSAETAAVKSTHRQQNKEVIFWLKYLNLITVNKIFIWLSAKHEMASIEAQFTKTKTEKGRKKRPAHARAPNNNNCASDMDDGEIFVLNWNYTITFDVFCRHVTLLSHHIPLRAALTRPNRRCDTMATGSRTAINRYVPRIYKNI